MHHPSRKNKSLSVSCRNPHFALATGLSVLFLLSAPAAMAQDWTLQTQLEFGAVITAGNTEDENIRFKGQFDAAREQWSYMASVDGFRSSKQDVLAAQRLYSVGSATYNVDPDNFVVSRLAHDDDRFSGYDSQSDFSVSFGQELMRNSENMTLRYTAGVGVRNSQESGPAGQSFSEAIVRLATDYQWQLSETARFIQSLSVDAGEETSIARSETAIESDIMANLSLKFGVRLKHQTAVPLTRKKTDSELAATVLLRL